MEQSARVALTVVADRIGLVQGRYLYTQKIDKEKGVREGRVL